jgi:hypothetical protein
MRFGSRLTLALSGAQPAPRSGNLTLRVRDEQPVIQHLTTLRQFLVCCHLLWQIDTDNLSFRPRRIALYTYN